MIEDDNRFFEQLGNPDGTNPEMVKRIDELDYNQYGRAIRQKDSNQLVGYILPLNTNQTEHLVLFVNGRIIKTRPINEMAEWLYREKLSPSEEPYAELGQSSVGNVIGLLSTVHNNYFQALRTAINEDPNQVPEIEEAIKQALSIAKALKDQRQKAKADSLTFLFGEIDNLLRPQDKPGFPLDLES